MRTAKLIFIFSAMAIVLGSCNGGCSKWKGNQDFKLEQTVGKDEPISVKVDSATGKVEVTSPSNGSKGAVTNVTVITGGSNTVINSTSPKTGVFDNNKVDPIIVPVEVEMRGSVDLTDMFKNPGNYLKNGKKGVDSTDCCKPQRKVRRCDIWYHIN